MADLPCSHAKILEIVSTELVSYARTGVLCTLSVLRTSVQIHSSSPQMHLTCLFVNELNRMAQVHASVKKAVCMCLYSESDQSVGLQRGCATELTGRQNWLQTLVHVLVMASPPSNYFVGVVWCGVVLLVVVEYLVAWHNVRVARWVAIVSFVTENEPSLFRQDLPKICPKGWPEIRGSGRKPLHSVRIGFVADSPTLAGSYPPFGRQVTHCARRLMLLAWRTGRLDCS